VPSRHETFGQAASEAQACGTPVVAFSVGGLQDIVLPKKTGFLAEPFEALSLAAGISWVLNRLEAERNSSTKTDCLQDAASRAAVATYSTITIGHQHKKEYELAVQNWMNP